jgi:hypothetical protein
MVHAAALASRRTASGRSKGWATLLNAMVAESPLRFDVYGRYTLLVERHEGNWRVLQAGADGKRGLRDDLVIPSTLPADEIASYLDDLLHEAARPGLRVRRLE